MAPRSLGVLASSRGQRFPVLPHLDGPCFDPPTVSVSASGGAPSVEHRLGCLELRIGTKVLEGSPLPASMKSVSS